MSESYNRVAEALDELQQYLCDRVPPLVVADSIEVLLEQPPELTASGIQSWVSSVAFRDKDIPVSNYLYHAVTKIYLLQEYNLVPETEFEPFIEGVKEAVMNYCPPEESQYLQQNLNLISQTLHSPGASSVDILFRPLKVGEEAAGGVRSGGKEGPSNPRIDHLRTRLEMKVDLLRRPCGRLPQKGEAPEVKRLVSETIAGAARAAQANSEIQTVLDFLQQKGIQTTPDDLFRALSTAVAG